MDSERNYVIDGVVLRHYPLKENDKIVVALTRDRGLKRMIGKGMRKPGSRLAGRLEPFREIRMLMTKGRGALEIVTQAEGLRRFPGLTEDLDCLAAAMAGAEVLLAFLEEADPVPEIYDLYLELLDALRPERPAQLILSGFELQAMDLLGYRPELESCISCERPIETGSEVYGLVIEGGGVICHRCDSVGVGRIRRMSPEGWWLVRQLQERALAQMSDLQAEPQRVLGMRRALRDYLNFRAERDLKAHGVFDWLPSSLP